jgi:CubicO group peptidase (beta-lactamase class C family)
MMKSRIWKSSGIWIRFILISLLFGFLVALFSGSLQIKRDIHADASLDNFKVYMNRRIPALMKKYRIPGCNIALVKDCEVVWTEAYGYADAESGRKLTINTPMSVQSITKSVTAWGVMRLVEKGLIDLDAPVSQYLKSDYLIENITTRQLLSHTAGLPLGDFTRVYSPGETMPSNRDVTFEEAVPVYKAGTRFSYSNTGYNLLEIVIEDITGQSFSEYIRTEIFLPLGMESATFEIDRKASLFLPTGYNLGGEPVPVYLYPSKASGGLFATANDIARFAASGMKETSVLSGESIRLMYTPQSQRIGIYGLLFKGYGLGHFIEKLPNGMLSISHGGQGNGIMTHFQAVPETGDAIVILTNSQQSRLFFAYVLRDWDRWRGFPSAGMGRIVLGQYGLCGVIGILISISLLLVFRQISPYYQRKQKCFRVLRVGIAFILFGILMRCAGSEYLLITSVYPILSVWLGCAIFVFAIALLISALLVEYPRIEQKAIPNTDLKGYHQYLIYNGSEEGS